MFIYIYICIQMAALFRKSVGPGGGGARHRPDLQALGKPYTPNPSIERRWHMCDSQGQILALAFSLKFELFPLRSEAAYTLNHVNPYTAKPSTLHPEP